MKDDLLLGGGIPSVGPKFDLKNYETIKCSKCGGIKFVSQYIIKKISGVEFGNGAKPTFVPLNIMVCADCGTIWDEDVRGYKLENEIKK